MAISPNDRLVKGYPFPVMDMICVSFYDDLRRRLKKVALNEQVLTFYDKPGNIR